MDFNTTLLKEALEVIADPLVWLSEIPLVDLWISDLDIIVDEAQIGEYLLPKGGVIKIA